MIADPAPLITWARTEADRLEGFTKAWTSANNESVECARARQFLRDHAPDSHFEIVVNNAFSYYNSGLEPVVKTAMALREWARYADEGLVSTLPFEARARVEASTDLMEQVQQLLDDAKVHPAAPVMLAGAALEEFLRAMLNSCPVQPIGKPGISSYATALQQGGLLTKQDFKDVTAWAGQRNEAAHGEFEKLTSPRAQIMVDGVNQFMRQKSQPSP